MVSFCSLNIRRHGHTRHKVRLAEFLSHAACEDTRLELAVKIATQGYRTAWGSKDKKCQNIKQPLEHHVWV